MNNSKTDNYMGREYIVKEENGMFKGYVQLDTNDDIFRLDYAEKMKIESLDDDWYVVVEPVNEYTNNRAWIENKCMDIINTLVEESWLDDFDDDYDDWDDGWFDDDDEEEDYE